MPALLNSPTNLAATRQNNNLNLTWDSNSLATSYRVSRNTSNDFASATLLNDSLTSNSFVDTGVSANTSYFYFVQACNANGCSDSSSGLNAALLNAPTNLAATRQNNNLSLSWNTNALATSYRVSRNTSNDFAAASLLTDAATTNSFVDTGVSPDTSYFYFVEACNANGCSNVSSSINTALLSAPVNLAATRQNNNLSLSWNTNALATSYRISRNTSNDFATASLLSNSATSNSFVDTGATADTSYFYFVQACNANGCSDSSSGLNAALLNAPTNLAATRQNNNLSLSWNTNALATSYRVSRNTTNNFASASLLNGSLSTNSFVDNGVQIDTNYFYFVEACNANGCSNVSLIQAALLSSPVNLTASRQNNNLNLAWDANALATSYRVLRNTTNDFASATLLSNTLTTNSFADTNPLANSRGFYFLQACNANGCSDVASIEEPKLAQAPLSNTGATSVDISSTSQLAASATGGSSGGEVTATASSNPSVAYSAGGQINLLEVGTTTITLTMAGNDTYLPVSTSYDLEVFETPNISTTQSLIKVANNGVLNPFTFLVNSGGSITSYSISNADSGGSLTANTGLSLDSSTGQLSGTGNATAVPAATYTITANGAAGSTSVTTIQIEITNGVELPALESLTYNAVVETTITDVVRLDNSGGMATSWVITGTGVSGPDISGIYDISNGLSFSQNTGEVTGTPAGPASAIEYTITAQNAGGTSNATSLTLAVLSKPVSNARVPKTITSYPIITGQTEADIDVKIDVDTDADTSTYEVSYFLKSDANTGNWSIDLQKVTPTSGTLPNFNTLAHDQVMTFRITATKANGAFNTIHKEATISTLSAYSISDSRIIEGFDGTKTMVFTVFRDGNTEQAGSVDYAVDTGVSTAKNSEGTTSGVTNTYAGGSGSIENDYAGSNSGTLNFAANGPQVQTIEFTVNGDYWKEINQKIIVSISNPVEGTISRAKGIGIIDEIDMNAMTSAFSLNDVNFEKPTYAIRVRRSSDDLQQDIGFDEDGNLDTESLLSFVGTSSTDVGFVTIWYNQSARDEHATQTDPNRQPTIVSTGTVRTNSAGLPAIIFNENVVNANVQGTDSESFNIAGTGVQATNIEIFIGYEYNTTEPGFAFNLGLQAVGAMISTHAPWSNGQTYWDVDNGPNYGNSRLHAQGAQIIDTYQDLIFAANLNFAGVGSANLNRTDARQSFFVDGEVIRASQGTFPANWAIPTNSDFWKIGATLDETRPQQMRVNEFLIYTNENSTPIDDSSQFIGSSANDSFTFAGDLEGIKAGFGYDALLIDASSMPSITLDSTADLANNTIAINSIEYIDARDNGQTDTIAITDAVVASTGRDTLEIHLDDTDTLRISSGFTAGGVVVETFNGVSYNKYTNGDLTLYVFGAAAVLNL